MDGVRPENGFPLISLMLWSHSLKVSIANELFNSPLINRSSSSSSVSKAVSIRTYKSYEIKLINWNVPNNTQKIPL